MTVTRQTAETIALEGTCGAEDAEPLLQSLIETPNARIDWRSCDQLHTAVAQIVLAAGASVEGPCGDGWVERWIALGPSGSKKVR